MLLPLLRKIFLSVILFLVASSANSSADLTEPLPSGVKHTFHSDILGDERSIIVQLPEGYDATAIAYPVIYLLDAEYFHHIAHAALQRILFRIGFDEIAWFIQYIHI